MIELGTLTYTSIIIYLRTVDRGSLVTNEECLNEEQQTLNIYIRTSLVLSPIHSKELQDFHSLNPLMV